MSTMNALNKKVTNLNLQTAEDFYKFFAAIPEEKWTCTSLDRGNGVHCILGHLGVCRTQHKQYVVPTRQCGRNLRRLVNIIKPNMKDERLNIDRVIDILWNFNDDYYGEFRHNPRTKILATLAPQLIKQ